MWKHFFASAFVLFLPLSTGASPMLRSSTTVSVASELAAPTLRRAVLHTSTGTDDKDPDTSIYVTVTDRDNTLVLADIANADRFKYIDHSEHDVTLIVRAPRATKDMCKGFHVHMWQETNGNDTWNVYPSVTLFFSDGSTLFATKEGGVSLKNNGANVDFTSG